MTASMAKGLAQYDRMDWAMGNLCEDPTTEKEVLSWESKKPAPSERGDEGRKP